MTWLTEVLRALRLGFGATAARDRASQTNARQTAGRYARGSVALQADAFVTQSELEREREEAKTYKFAS